MTLRILEVVLNYLVGLLYLSLIGAVFWKGYWIFDHHFNSNRFDNEILNLMWFYLGLIPYTALCSLSLWLYCNFLSQDDKITNAWIKYPRYWYYRRLNSNEIAEVGIQTFSDMVTSLFPISNSEMTGNIPGSTRQNFPINYKYTPDSPVWAGFITKKVEGSPALLDSFNLDSTGIVMGSCKKFEVNPASISVTFENLGGVEELKRKILLQVVAPFASASSSHKLSETSEPPLSKIDIPRGVLLIGGEGTGKTSIVHAIVNELQTLLPLTEVKFYKVEGANCFGSFVGTGATFRDLFYYVEDNSPLAIILFENIDQLYDRSISLFLSELNSAPKGKILVFATTTKKEQLHERLLSVDKPGNIDFCYELDLPDFWERVAILQIHFQKRECPIEDQHITKIARRTASYTAGELEKLVMNINMKSVERYNISYKGRRDESPNVSNNLRHPCISPSRTKITTQLIDKELDRYCRRRRARKAAASEVQEDTSLGEPNFCEISSGNTTLKLTKKLAEVDILKKKNK